MRTTRTFVLRILVDTEDPSPLRGTVRSIADDEEQTFADERALREVLQEMCRARARGPSGRPSPGHGGAEMPPQGDGQ
jgi:hypothetical protein